MSITLNQNKVFTALCLQPTAHVFSNDFKSMYNLTSGGIRSALNILQKKQLVIKDSAGVWRIRNQGMQAWYFALKTYRSTEEVEELRFGEWEWEEPREVMPDRAERKVKN